MRERYELKRPFVMYTGGIEYRKNIEGLIRAFGRLPQNIRQQQQLAIICSVRKEDRQYLTGIAEQNGLQKHDLIITGFVPDEDLVDLYNICTVFTFPSWHEGFGLPVLEAMSCGAPVIGANTSSLPEVIGREDALFDPYDDESIAAKLSEVLTNEAFRRALAQHGLERAKCFSWSVTAKRALSALEQCCRRSERRIRVGGLRPKLAYVSPLPPERSGISEYSAELLPALSRYYEIDVVVAQQEISDPYIKAAFPIRTIEWFRNNARKYDRVLYHFGNSSFHAHMPQLLAEISGVVVLHDFFLSDLFEYEYMDAQGFAANAGTSELYKSHGYEAVRQRFHTNNSAEIRFRYPENLSVLQRAQGIIVHSAASVRLAKQWYNGDFSDWSLIPHLRDIRLSTDRDAVRSALGLRSSDFLVCSFGFLGPTKLNLRLLQAWLNSDLVQDENCKLIFVGENHDGEYGEEILGTIRSYHAEQRVRITGWVDMAVFREYLAAADIAVQLRTHSRGEASGTILDCMNYGLATIVNAHGSMVDLDGDAVWKLPDEFTNAQLTEALESLWQSGELRKTFGARARELIVERHTPSKCAAQYHEAIEQFSVSAVRGTRALASAIAGSGCALADGEPTGDPRTVDCRKYATARQGVRQSAGRHFEAWENGVETPMISTCGVP